MPNSVGVVFASTGGHKIVRAIRSLRRIEPDIPIHVVLDVASNTWRSNLNPPVAWFESQPNVRVRCFANNSYINGNLNEGMKWMREIGYEYACLLHDDIIFSPLEIHHGSLSETFNYPLLKESSGLSFGLFQAFVDKQVWRREPAEWDKMDLESVGFWQQLFPGGRPADYYKKGGRVYELHFPEFFVQHLGVEKAYTWTRLGPTGMIVPVDKWEAIGGFDETRGIFYDSEYPAVCAEKGWPRVFLVPNIPHLHLHNQSIGYADLATGIWNDTEKAFLDRFGQTATNFWATRDL